jgi:hypothetical protein
VSFNRISGIGFYKKKEQAGYPDYAQERRHLPDAPGDPGMRFWDFIGDIRQQCGIQDLLQNTGADS